MAERCETCGQQTEYNGWNTYETWLVNLWLSNDQGTYDMVREMASESVEAEAEGGRMAVGSLMDRLSDTFDQNSEFAPDLGPNLYGDLLGAAFSRVDWREIAEHWLEDVREEVEQA